MRNSQELGNRGMGMGMDALSECNGNTSDVHDQQFNSGNPPSPSVPPLAKTTQPLGTVLEGTGTV